MSTQSALPSSRVPDPADAPPLGWGIVGTGGIARAFASALRLHTRQRLVAVGSRTQASADAFVADHDARPYGSYEALVADPDVDAVYIASPHSHHAEHALLAISAGKHALVEKSFTANAEQAKAVVAAARSGGVTVVEAMWTRFLPGTDVVRRLLEEGALGQIESVVADHGQAFPFDPAHRLYASELAGGAMLDLGVYPVSYAHFVLGAPGRLAARGTFAPTGVDRQISAVLDEHAAHPGAHALVTTTLAAKTPTTATISGSAARVELPGPFYTPQPVTLIERTGGVRRSPQPTITGHEGLAYEAAHFAGLVAEGRRESPWLPLDETVAIMETMDRLLAQARRA